MTQRPGYKRILEQVFPKDIEELPGLYVKWAWDNQVFPYQIIREFDEWKDTWQGQQLANPRRNKWWVKDVNGKVELACLDRQPNDEYKYEFCPELLFFKTV